MAPHPPPRAHRRRHRPVHHRRTRPHRLRLGAAAGHRPATIRRRRRHRDEPRRLRRRSPTSRPPRRPRAQLNVIALPDDWANYGEIMDAVRGEVPRDHDQRGRPRRLERRGDRGRRQPQGPGHRARRLRPRHRGHPRTAPTTSRRTRSRTGTRSPTRNKESTGLCVERLQRHTCRSATTPKFDARADEPRRPARRRLQGRGRASTATRRRPVRPSPPSASRPCSPAARSTTSSPASTSSPKLNEGRQLPPGRRHHGDRSPRARPRSSSTGATNNLAARGRRSTTGRSSSLPGTGYASFYNQAINKDAPHPAAARLWQEFLYSDEAQNLCLVGGAYPVTHRGDDGGRHGRRRPRRGLPRPDDTVVPTAEQAEERRHLLGEKWAAAVQ